MSEMHHWRDTTLEPVVAASPVEVLAAIGEIAAPTDDPMADVEVNDWVFRGIACSSWEPTSSLYRELIALKQGTAPDEKRHGQRERTRLSQARNWLSGWEDPQFDAHLLASLQHHGVPTRLMDVTTNPITALWMACREQQERDAVILALEVAKLKTFVTSSTTLADGGPGSKGSRNCRLGAQVHTSYGYYQAMLDHSSAAEEPFILIPSLRDRRMIAQGGRFIVSAVPQAGSASGSALYKSLFPPKPETEDANSSHSFDDWNYRTASIIIPSSLKQRLLGMLRRSFDHSERSMFPDITGMRDYFRNVTGRARIVVNS